MTNELQPQAYYQALRKESFDEQTLINNRLSWFLTSQGFLLTVFAVTMGLPVRRFWWFATILIPAFGILFTILIRYPIRAACLTIEFWQKREEEFFEGHPEFRPLNLAERDEKIHVNSMRFPQVLPWCFFSLWVLIGALSNLQLWFKIIPSLPDV